MVTQAQRGRGPMDGNSGLLVLTAISSPDFKRSFRAKSYTCRFFNKLRNDKFLPLTSFELNSVSENSLPLAKQANVFSQQKGESHCARFLGPDIQIFGAKTLALLMAFKFLGNDKFLPLTSFELHSVREN